MQTDMMRISSAVEISGRSPRWIADMVESGNLKPREHNGVVYVDLNEVIRLSATRCAFGSNRKKIMGELRKRFGELEWVGVSLLEEMTGRPSGTWSYWASNGMVRAKRDGGRWALHKESALRMHASANILKPEKRGSHRSRSSVEHPATNTAPAPERPVPPTPKRAEEQAVLDDAISAMDDAVGALAGEIINGLLHKPGQGTKFAPITPPPEVLAKPAIPELDASGALIEAIRNLRVCEFLRVQRLMTELGVTEFQAWIEKSL